MHWLLRVATRRASVAAVADGSAYATRGSGVSAMCSWGTGRPQDCMLPESLCPRCRPGARRRTAWPCPSRRSALRARRAATLRAAACAPATCPHSCACTRRARRASRGCRCARPASLGDQARLCHGHRRDAHSGRMCMPGETIRSCRQEPCQPLSSATRRCVGMHFAGGDVSGNMGVGWPGLASRPDQTAPGLGARVCVRAGQAGDAARAGAVLAAAWQSWLRLCCRKPACLSTRAASAPHQARQGVQSMCMCRARACAEGRGGGRSSGGGGSGGGGGAPAAQPACRPAGRGPAAHAAAGGRRARAEPPRGRGARLPRRPALAGGARPDPALALASPACGACDGGGRASVLQRSALRQCAAQLGRCQLDDDQGIALRTPGG